MHTEASRRSSCGKEGFRPDTKESGEAFPQPFELDSKGYIYNSRSKLNGKVFGWRSVLLSKQQRDAFEGTMASLGYGGTL